MNLIMESPKQPDLSLIASWESDLFTSQCNNAPEKV